MTTLKNEELLLIEAVKKMTSQTGVSRNAFFQALAVQLVQDGLKDPEPREKAAKHRWVSQHRMKCQRIFEEGYPIPMNWKWSWIRVLDQPYRTRLIGDLISITGSLYVPAPRGPSDRSPQVTNLPNMIKEFSEMMSSSKPAQDGHLSPEDHPGETREYMEELFDLLEATVNEVFNVQRGTGIMSDKMMRHTLAQCFGYESPEQGGDRGPH